jgi:hypothetical protein
MSEEFWVQLNEASKYEISNLGNVRIRLKSGVIRPVRVYETASGRRHIYVNVRGRNVHLYLDIYMDAFF